MCAVQRHKIYPPCCSAVCTAFSCCKTETRYPLNNSASFPAPQPLVTTILLSVSITLTTLGTSCKQNRTIFVFCVTVLFHLAECPQFFSLFSTCQHSFLFKAEQAFIVCIWHIKKNIQIKIYCSSESGIGIVKSLGDIVIKSLHSILFLVYYKLLPKNVSHGWTEKVFQ